MGCGETTTDPTRPSATSARKTDCDDRSPGDPVPTGLLYSQFPPRTAGISLWFDEQPGG